MKIYKPLMTNLKLDVLSVRNLQTNVKTFTHSPISGPMTLEMTTCSHDTHRYTRAACNNIDGLRTSRLELLWHRLFTGEYEQITDGTKQT